MSWSSPNWRSSSSPWQNEDEGTDSRIFRNEEDDDDVEVPPLLAQSSSSGLRNNSLASSTGSILPDIPTDTADSDELNKIYAKIKKKRESFYWGRTIIMWGVGFMVYIALALIVYSEEAALPTPLLANATADNVFCEERAYKYLQYFGEEIDARPIGSVANRRAATYIFETLTEMTQKDRGSDYPSISVRRSSAPGNTKYLNLLLNDTNGNNNKEMKRDSDDLIWQNIYFDGIENIVVVVEGEKGLNQSLLVVAHFDSSTLSPATTDDATGVALLIELVHNLIHTKSMKHTVIFLFTNAQEFGSLGIKSFVDLDPLSDTVAAFLNIDSVPSKRAVLLRSTGGWIDEVFMKAAPDPRANVMGHHALETGLFNMDSDFFVLSNMAPGLDFTDYNHRKLQHTLDDTLEHYRAGSMQFLGENILPTIKEIASGDWLDRAPNFEPNVYYSILGLFSTVYSTAASMRAHIIIAALLVAGLGFMLFVKMRQYQLLLNKKNHPLTFLGLGIASLALSLLAGILFSVLVALLLWEFNPMFYYSYPQLAIFAFGVPALLGMFSVQGVFHLLSRRRGVGIGLAEKHSLWAVNGMWATVMCATASLTYDYGWTYPIFLFGLFSLVGLVTQLILHKVFSVVKRKYNLTSKVSSQSIGHEPYNEHKPLLDDDLDHDLGSSHLSHSNHLDNSDHNSFFATNHMQLDMHSSSSMSNKRRNYHFYKSLCKILIAAIVFLVATVVPCLVLFELTQFFITFVSAEIGHVTMATIIALVAFVAYVNFFPIARRGGNYWLVIMFLLFGTVFLIIFATAYHEAYTGHSPLGLSVKHRFLALHHRVSRDVSEEVKDHSEIILSTTFPVNLRSIIEKINFTDCHFNDVDPTECRIESGPPNAFIPYLGIKNSTVNGTLHDIMITGITPGSFVHLFEFPNLKPSMVQVNNQTIDKEDVQASFYYFVATDYRWTLRMQYNGTEPLMLRLHSHFNSLIHSTVIDTLADKLPDWVTLVGSGTGLVVTETNWSFS